MFFAVFFLSVPEDYLRRFRRTPTALRKLVHALKLLDDLKIRMNERAVPCPAYGGVGQRMTVPPQDLTLLEVAQHGLEKTEMIGNERNALALREGLKAFFLLRFFPSHLTHAPEYAKAENLAQHLCAQEFFKLLIKRRLKSEKIFFVF
jgi:hypothetical protein